MVLFRSHGEIVEQLLAEPISVASDFPPQLPPGSSALDLAGGHYVPLIDPISVDLPAPDVVHSPSQSAPETEVFGKLAYRTSPAYVAKLTDCLVMGNRFVVVTSDRRPLYESVPTYLGKKNPNWFNRDAGTLDRLFKLPVMEIDEPVALICNSNWRNYWHWHTQTLPNIALLRRAGLYPGKVKLLCCNPADWREISLSLLGVQPSDTIGDSVSRVFKIRELYYPSFLDKTNMWLQSPELLDTYQAIAADVRGRAPPQEGLELIYISRLDSKRRKLLNEIELSDALEKFGFVTVIPGEINYLQQVAMMRSARVIVAPHGAGLTNLAFAPKPSVVIEVIPSYWYSEAKSAFRVLAQLAGHRYCAVVSHDTNSETMDWKVDVDAVVAVARRFL